MSKPDNRLVVISVVADTAHKLISSRNTSLRFTHAGLIVEPTYLRKFIAKCERALWMQDIPSDSLSTLGWQMRYVSLGGDVDPSDLYVICPEFKGVADICPALVARSENMRCVAANRLHPKDELLCNYQVEENGNHGKVYWFPTNKCNYGIPEKLLDIHLPIEQDWIEGVLLSSGRYKLNAIKSMLVNSGNRFEDGGFRYQFTSEYGLGINADNILTKIVHFDNMEDENIEFVADTPHGKLSITLHALKRYKERKKKKKKGAPISQYVKNMKSNLQNSVQVHRKNNVKQILKYNFTCAKYLMFENWIFVVDEDDRVATCYSKGMNPLKCGYSLQYEKV
jgi:predicted transcriptional regulator